MLKFLVVILALELVQGSVVIETLQKLFESLPTATFEDLLNLLNPTVENGGLLDYNLDICEDEYDYVIVGCGTAGSVLANRLSEDAGNKVLALEAGFYPWFLTEIPGLVALNQFSDYNWKYKAEPQADVGGALEGEVVSAHQGKGVGGTTLINYMLAFRGNKDDYNKWGALNPGWSYEEVLPYFIKLENTHLAIEDTPIRGHEGNLWISDVPYRTESSQSFVRAAQEAGYTYLDHNGYEQLGVSFMQATQKDGFRHNARKAYIDPTRGRSNLQILTGAFATKLIIENNVAVGVEYIRKNSTRTVRARKEVIVASGSFNSPKLLMLSGIGPAQDLQALGIEVVQDLAVGRRVYDHPTNMATTFVYNTTGLTLTMEEILTPNTLQEFAQGKGILTILGGVEAVAFTQTPLIENPAARVPDAEIIHAGAHIGYDFGLFTHQSFGFKTSVYEALWKPLTNLSATHTIPMLLHPKSYGTVSLRSSNPEDPPVIHHNYYTDPEGHDIKTVVAAAREIIRITEFPGMQQYGAKLLETPMPGCEEEVFLSDEYLECAIRQSTFSLWHHLGACRMGPQNDPEAVVDERLKVRGVENLRVADISVIPVTLSGHSMLPAYMIGEKAADIILEDN